MKIGLPLVLCLSALLMVVYCPCQANILPREVLVVYNVDYPYPGATVNMSANTALYYAAERGIPASNVCGVSTQPYEIIDKSVDYKDLTNQIEDYILTNINPNPSDPQSFIDNPIADPIKAIVLCYGVPSQLAYGDRWSCIDSSLNLMFQRTPWGNLPINRYGGGTGAANPYAGSDMDFASFRGSSSNEEVVAPPNLRIVRYLDQNTAIAGGECGIIYRGVRSNGEWSWTPVQDEDKQLISYAVSDIYVADEDNIFLCTGDNVYRHNGGAIMHSSDGGATWSLIRAPHPRTYPHLCAPELRGVSFQRTTNGWVGWAVGDAILRGTVTGNGNWQWDDLTADLLRNATGKLGAGFTANGVAVADSGHVWICGEKGIYACQNASDPPNNTTWTKQTSGVPDNRIFNKLWMRWVTDHYEGIAIGEGGQQPNPSNPPENSWVLFTNDGGANWSVPISDNSVRNSLTDMAVFPAADGSFKIAVSGDNAKSYLYDSASGWSAQPLGLVWGEHCTSTAWNGTDLILAVDKPYLKTPNSTGGNVSWSTALTIPDIHWKHRYLVTRLDAFSTPLVSTSFGQVPQDVKEMINRSVGASGVCSGNACRFEYDFAPSDSLTQWMDTLSQYSGAGTVFCRPSNNPNSPMAGQQCVIGFDRDWYSWPSTTTWGRTGNQWCDGAVTVFSTNDGQRDGVAGAISAIDEPWQPCGTHDVFLHYASGFSWAESAYTEVEALGSIFAVLGDPLMAPYAVHPTVGFIAPSPESGRHVSGPVTLCASASPYGTGSLNRVEYWVIDPNEKRRYIGSAPNAPYECTWDTVGSGFPFSDGSYSIEAVAYQLGNKAGITEITCPVTLANASNPTVTITWPNENNLAVGSLTPVTTSVGSGVNRVEFWLFDSGHAIKVGEANNSPFTCSISSPPSDGVYDLQAIAYNDSLDTASYSERRQIILHNSGPIYNSVADLATAADETDLMLTNVLVTAGTSSAMDGAFYVEDSSRIAGIRVATTQTVQTDRLVTVQGILHSSTSIIERYIEASQIWDMNALGVSTPLGMPNYALGGNAPTGMPGITGGIGLYNLGLLVRAWGNVTYVGDDFVYIDDGSSLQDGNTFPGPIIVPLDGSLIPSTHPPVKGLRVYFGSLDKPGIGDYIAVTGISSTKQIGSNIVRYLRVRSQQDIEYPRHYQRCAQSTNGDFHTPPPASTPIPADGLVRLIDAYVWCNPGYYYGAASFGVLHTEEWLSPYMWFYSDVVANTQLELDQCVTITGIAQQDEYGTYYVVADKVYLGGSEFGALGVPSTRSFAAASSSERGGGPFRPWPRRTASEILASPGFRDLDNRPNCIGWALAQMDGASIDLKAEIICNEWYNGRSLGLLEPYEPRPAMPRLVLCLPKSVADIALWKQIDIVGGTLATLSNGQRAVLYPQAVYLRTDQKGTPILMMPKTFDSSGEPEDWPWRRLVYSR